MEPLVSSSEVDRKFGWSIGRANQLARSKKLPHYRLPDGAIRFVWMEIEKLVRHVPVKAAHSQMDCEVRS